MHGRGAIAVDFLPTLFLWGLRCRAVESHRDGIHDAKAARNAPEGRRGRTAAVRAHVV